MTSKEEIRELRERLCCELFDVWKEAKSTTDENWDDVTWESLPEKHKREYYLTANRILSDPAILVRSKDQTPPLNPYTKRSYIGQQNVLKTLEENNAHSYYEEAQQDMLNAGWVKVVKKE